MNASSLSPSAEGLSPTTKAFSPGVASLDPTGATHGEISAKTAVESAFDRCAASLYRFLVVRVGRDRHAADDLMQQLWLAARERGAAVAEAQAEAWLWTVARNLIRTRWRRSGRRPAETPLHDAELAGRLSERLASGPLPDEWLSRREVADQLLLAVTALPHADQSLLVGVYFEGRPHAALAAELGVGERAIEGRLYRARAALREMLRRLGTEEPA